MKRLLGILTAAVLAVPLAGAAHATPPSPHWRHVDVRTDQQFRGLDAVDARTAWVGGSAGGVWRTTNGGRTWQDVSPPGAKGLLFRDVEAQSARVAMVLSIGNGTDSRIYRTTDGGRTWTKAFVSHRKKAFYDCMAMWPGGKNGLLMGDPLGGRFLLRRTTDGGASWQPVPRRSRPKALDGEFGFAASGTCLVTAGAHDVFLATGGGASRILASDDRGRTWIGRDSQIPASAAGGVFSVAFAHRQGIAVGGDFEHPERGTDASAYSHSLGHHWNGGGDLSGYRSGVAWVRPGVAVAVGPTGGDVTRDGGRTWTRFSRLDLDAVQCVHGACWGSGPDGVVARLVMR
jgi:photosystem II stability/assembly factor-like uncharacterized protein